MIKKLSLLLTVFCVCVSIFQLTAQEADPTDPKFTSNILISGVLSSADVVPEIDDNNVNAVAGLFVNENRNEIVFNLYADQNAGNLTSVVVREGAKGMNGPIVFDLTEKIEGKKINTTLRNFAKSIVTDLILGKYYVEIETEDITGITARGQLSLETPDAYFGIANSDKILNGESDSPSVGIISTNYSHEIRQFEVNFFAANLSSPITGAFLYVGDETTTDSIVAVDLTEFVIDNRLYAELDATEFFGSIQSENLYLKIHTESFPLGEIRTQLEYTDNLIADGWLSGAQIVPDQSGEGTSDAGILGFGFLSFDSDFRSMEYYILTDDIEEEISSLILHNEAKGKKSGPIFNIPITATQKVVNGTIASKNIAFFAGIMLRGNAYMVVRTEDFPKGKVRGQMYRIARDGRLFTFCKEQAGQDIVSDADGGGIIAIDRKLTHSHIILSNYDLTSPRTQVSLNSGEIGEDGPVLLDMTSIDTNSFIDYFWHESTNATVFEEEAAFAIKAESAYFKVSTETYPDGETRGQTLSELNCTNRFNESADLELSLDVSRVHYAQYDTMAFCFTIQNNGAVAANNVEVSVPLPDGFVYCYDITGDGNGEYNLYYQTWNVGTLAPGQSMNLKLVNLAMSSGNNINYFAEVDNSSAYDHDSTPGNQNFDADEDDEVATTIIAIENGGAGTGNSEIDLEVDMEVDNMNVGQYENANYTVTVKNNGPDFANNVLMNVKIPSGLAYVSHSASKGDVRLYNGTWFIQELEPGETATFNIELFTLWPSSTIPYFVQVHAVDEPDKDSTPGNVYDFIASEDDEARVDLLTVAGMAQNNVTFRIEDLNQGILYPNPAFDQINMDIQSGMDIEGEILIYNVSGQILLRKQTTFNQGFNEFNHDVSEFPVGTYFIKVPALDITSKFLKI